jgi:hypothetical protein
VLNSSDETVRPSLSRTEEFRMASPEKEIAGSKETLVRVPNNHMHCMYKYIPVFCCEKKNVYEMFSE